MQKSKLRVRAREALDIRASAWRQLPSSGARPNGGWIRAIREALGMSAADLADRMGVTQSTVSRFEASERSGRVQLDTLQRVADALDCDFVYALVPRRPLEDVVNERARSLAMERLGRLGHTMALEAQDLDEARLQAKVDVLASHIKDSPGLWHDRNGVVSARSTDGLG